MLPHQQAWAYARCDVCLAVASKRADGQRVSRVIQDYWLVSLMEDVDETQPDNRGLRIPAAATGMQEQAEEKRHGTKEHGLASALGREHARPQQQSCSIISSSSNSRLGVMTIEPSKSDRTSHVPLARVL